MENKWRIYFFNNNWCVCVIIDQTFYNIRGEQWPDFQVTTAMVSCEILTGMLLRR